MQIADRLGHALGVEIGFGGDENGLEGRGQAQRDHVLLHRLAEADAGVETLRDDVDERVVGVHLDGGYREVAPFNDEPYAHHWFEKAPI